MDGSSPLPSPPSSPSGHPQCKNSGFFFGFLLGVVQMFVWLLYDKPWTLPAGGAVVGYITNWLAIKLIFEPVDPVKMGPFVLQGLFLKRQDEVSHRRNPKTVSMFHLESDRCRESASRQR